MAFKLSGQKWPKKYYEGTQIVTKEVNKHLFPFKVII